MSYIDALDLQARTAESYKLHGGLNAIMRLETGQRLYLEAAERMVCSGDTYFIAEPIIALISAASRTLPANLALYPEMFPTERAFGIMEDYQNEHGAWAFGWLAPKDGRGAIFMTLSTRRHKYTGAQLLLPDRVMAWDYGMSLETFQVVVEDESEAERGHFRRMVYLFATMITLLDQRILAAADRRLPRAAQRRLARSIVHEPLVRIVELRRRIYPTQQHMQESHDWSCQWLVSGHWRQQWYSSLGIHQPKWIAPYIKGPEDKPLKAPRATVFAVVR